MRTLPMTMSMDATMLRRQRHRRRHSRSESVELINDAANKQLMQKKQQQPTEKEKDEDRDKEGEEKRSKRKENKPSTTKKQESKETNEGNDFVPPSSLSSGSVIVPRVSKKVRVGRRRANTQHRLSVPPQLKDLNETTENAKEEEKKETKEGIRGRREEAQIEGLKRVVHEHGDAKEEKFDGDEAGSKLRPDEYELRLASCQHVKVYDFSPQSVEFFPFFLRKRSVVLLLFNLCHPIEDIVSNLQTWCKRIHQASDYPTLAPLSPMMRTCSESIHRNNNRRQQLEEEEEGDIAEGWQQQGLKPCLPPENFPLIFLVGTHYHPFSSSVIRYASGPSSFYTSSHGASSASSSPNSTSTVSKKHMGRLEEALNGLAAQYPNIKGAYALSNASLEGVASLRDALLDAVRAHEQAVMTFAKTIPPSTMVFEAVLVHLKRSSSFLLPWQRYAQLAKRNGLKKKSHLRVCTQFWSESGFLLHINDPSPSHMSSSSSSSSPSTKAASLSQWLFLDDGYWLMDAYVRLLRYVRRKRQELLLLQAKDNDPKAEDVGESDEEEDKSKKKPKKTKKHMEASSECNAGMSMQKKKGTSILLKQKSYFNGLLSFDELLPERYTANENDSKQSDRVWPTHLYPTNNYEAILMLLQKLGLVYFVQPQKQKVLLLDTTTTSTTKNGVEQKKEHSTLSTTDGSSVDPSETNLHAEVQSMPSLSPSSPSSSTSPSPHSPSSSSSLPPSPFPSPPPSASSANNKEKANNEEEATKQKDDKSDNTEHGSSGAAYGRLGKSQQVTLRRRASMPAISAGALSLEVKEEKSNSNNNNSDKTTNASPKKNKKKEEKKAAKPKNKKKEEKTGRTRSSTADGRSPHQVPSLSKSGSILGVKAIRKKASSPSMTVAPRNRTEKRRKRSASLKDLFDGALSSSSSPSSPGRRKKAKDAGEEELVQQQKEKESKKKKKKQEKKEKKEEEKRKAEERKKEKKDQKRRSSSKKEKKKEKRGKEDMDLKLSVEKERGEEEEENEKKADEEVRASQLKEKEDKEPSKVTANPLTDEEIQERLRASQQRREKLVKTKRHHFKTVYRNMRSIEKELHSLQGTFTGGSEEDFSHSRFEMVTIGNNGQRRLFIPQLLLPFKTREQENEESFIRGLHHVMNASRNANSGAVRRRRRSETETEEKEEHLQRQQITNKTKMTADDVWVDEKVLKEAGWNPPELSSLCALLRKGNKNKKEKRERSSSNESNNGDIRRSIETSSSFILGTGLEEEKEGRRRSRSHPKQNIMLHPVPIQRRVVLFNAAWKAENNNAPFQAGKKKGGGTMIMAMMNRRRGYLPPGLFPKLVAQLLQVLELPLIWQTGALLVGRSHNAGGGREAGGSKRNKEKEKALLRLFENENKMEIEVYGGEQPEHLLELLLHHLKEVASSFANVTSVILTPCSHCLLKGKQDPYMFSLEQCEAAMGQGSTILHCQHKSNKHPVPVFLHQLAPELALSWQALERYEVNYDDIRLNSSSNKEDKEGDGDVIIIGTGSHAIVKKGVYNGEAVAVKEFMLPETTTDSISQAVYLNIVKEFRSEAMLMSGLSHPNVVRLVGFCKAPRSLALILEYLPDGDLFHFLRKEENKNMPWSDRLKIALDIAKGMFFLHSTCPPIIHRDLKSLNILMNGKTAKVADFGLSTVYALTTSGRGGVDIPFWLAPEVIQGEESTEKADVFSYAIILWELATMRMPYAEYDYSFMTELERRIVEEGLRPSLDGLAADVPPLYAKLIRSCWKENYSDRPSFFKIIPRLEGILQSLSSPFSSASSSSQQTS